MSTERSSADPLENHDVGPLGSAVSEPAGDDGTDGADGMAGPIFPPPETEPDAPR